MNLDLLLLAGLYVFATITTIAFFFQRYRWRRRRRMGKRNWGFYPSAASMGNALQQLSVFWQPTVQHILEHKQAEDVDEDDKGAPKDPRAHLHRQAEKIRKGEVVERLTALVNSDRP